MTDKLLVAQLSDPHVSVGVGDTTSARALGAAVEEILGLDPVPSAVLVTGDLASGGTPREYDRVREILAPLPMPVHPLPGNHDDRDALRAAFPDHEGVAGTDGFVQYAVRADALRIVACDTLVPGHGHGRLCPERLGWIETELRRENAMPTILAMHHPPLLTGIREADRIGLRAEDRTGLAGIVGRAPGVARIVAGHVHRTVVGQLAGCPTFACPSVYLQGLLDLSPSGRLALVREPPGIALHVRTNGHPLVSHVQPVGDYGTPLYESPLG